MYMYLIVVETLKVFVQIIPEFAFASFHVKLVYRFGVWKDFGHEQFL